MNDFGFIDYLRPVVPKNDYRTSSYIGHVYMHDTVPRQKEPKSQQLPGESNIVEDTPLKTEQMEQYTKKSPDNCVLRNPPIPLKCIHYMKTYEDTRLRAVPKLLQEHRSTYNSNFRCELPITPENPPQYNLPSAVKNTLKIHINRSKPGYTRLIDSNLTSQRIDYPPHSAEQQRGIGGKDHITFWNWIKEDHGKHNVWTCKEDMCEYKNRCIARRNEFITQIKHVPNHGLTTEFRSNYTPPVRRSSEQLTLDTNQNFDFESLPVQNYTENKIYGSGERLDKYINTQPTRRHVLIKQ